MFQPQGCTYYSPAQQQQQSAPMRRPKAAIPILPPPENQQHQTGRGRGRSTQPQQMNQPGSIQQTEQEVKTNSVEDDQKIISEQFDNMQIEQPTDVQETQKVEDSSVIINTVVENTEKVENIKNIEPEATVNLENTTADQLNDISANDSSKVIINEQDIIPLKSTQVIIEETKNDSNKIESTTTEITAVEETAA